MKYLFKNNKKMIYVIIAIALWCIIAFVKHISQDPQPAVFNNKSDNSVYQVEDYLKSKHKDYAPIQWWQVQEAHIEEGKYFVRHRYKAENIENNHVFFLDSIGNVTLIK